MSAQAPPTDTPDGRRLIITASVSISQDELRLQFTRSSGPGGQHVNKSETQVELSFDLIGSPSLTSVQKALAQRRLGARVDGAGLLHVTSSGTRSQLRNREEAVARFVDLMRLALREHKPRRPTRPTAASRERRLEGKRRRAQLKDLRRE